MLRLALAASFRLPYQIRYVPAAVPPKTQKLRLMLHITLPGCDRDAQLILHRGSEQEQHRWYLRCLLSFDILGRSELDPNGPNLAKIIANRQASWQSTHNCIWPGVKPPGISACQRGLRHAKGHGDASDYVAVTSMFISIVTWAICSPRRDDCLRQAACAIFCRLARCAFAAGQMQLSLYSVESFGQAVRPVAAIVNELSMVLTSGFLGQGCSEVIALRAQWAAEFAAKSWGWLVSPALEFCTFGELVCFILLTPQRKAPKLWQLAMSMVAQFAVLLESRLPDLACSDILQQRTLRGPSGKRRRTNPELEIAVMQNPKAGLERQLVPARAEHANQTQTLPSLLQGHCKMLLRCKVHDMARRLGT